MEEYRPRPSPDSLRRAALGIITAAGATTGLLLGIGWRFFQAGSRNTALATWVLTVVATLTLLTVAGVTLTVARLLETGMARANRSTREAERRYGELGAELARLRARIDALSGAGNSGPRPVVRDTDESASTLE